MGRNAKIKRERKQVFHSKIYYHNGDLVVSLRFPQDEQPKICTSTGTCAHARVTVQNRANK